MDSRVIMTIIRFISLVAIFVLTGCGGGPTQPSQEDRIALYAGQWRGLIGDFQVVVQIHAGPGFGFVDLTGTGSAVNRTTGETNKLTIFGTGSMNDGCSTCSSFNFRLDQGAVGPGGSIGRFAGQLSGDKRSWIGGYRAWSNLGDFVDVFGVDDVPVTFIKD